MRSVAIIGEDLAYNRSLAGYIGRNRVSELSATAFRDISELSDWISSSDGHILIAEEEIADDIRRAGFTPDFYLTEKKNAGEGYIFKYQSMELIMRQLYEKEAEAVIEKCREELKVISVIDPVFIFGASAECLKLAADGNKDENLILSFNPFFQGEGEGGYKGGLSELIYSINLRGKDWIKDRASIITHLQMADCITGLRNPFELSYFNSDMAGVLISSLAEGEKYKRLYIDCGYLPQGAAYLLSISDEIRIIDNDDKSVAKNLVWQLKNHFGEAILERIKEECAVEPPQEIVPKRNLGLFKGKW